ncbi:MAG: hypothetical protein BroJett029_24080 [Alphaproteobacteria bacterium]|nr:MAG: hypothetical protein BroJett029_24080 [Alphaproteobacteria bacterium]
MIRTSALSALVFVALLASSADARAHSDQPGGMMGQGPMMMGPGMMQGGPGWAGHQGWGMGPGMMGCPMGYWGTGPGMMGPGMMGPGMGPGMMGPGMMGPGMMGPGMMGPGMMGQGMGRGMMMGPGSPGPMPHALPSDLSAEQVRHMLGHHLAWQGNPNLRLGTVEETSDDTITAEIVTQNGDLVQRLTIDRHTGAMQPAPAQPPQ